MRIFFQLAFHRIRHTFFGIMKVSQKMYGGHTHVLYKYQVCQLNISGFGILEIDPFCVHRMQYDKDIFPFFSHSTLTGLLNFFLHVYHGEVDLSWKYEYYWLNISLSKALNLNDFLWRQIPL